MLFNSIPFLFFFLTVYLPYHFLNRKWQNRWLLLASAFFYGYWDWRFLLLLLGTASLDYASSLIIYKSDIPRTRKLWLFASTACNLSVLFFFKYFHFFADTAQRAFALTGVSFSIHTLNIILPLGISFYTFQAISYVVDVYRKKTVPISHYPDYLLFILFFPQLIAGPIERAAHLIPQILKERKTELAGIYDGFYLIAWGLFQKICVADNLSKTASRGFDGTALHAGETWISVYAFAFQIYCDFSGYSNIARGLAKCLGFDLMLNFNRPYRSANPKEFWQRWHISLSTWLRDYLYIPLGGNRLGKRITYRNLIITMFLGGLWHGAAWHFVAWGIYHGLLLVAFNFAEEKKISLPLPKFLKVFLFFNLTCAGWVFFRAPSFRKAIDMLYIMVFDGSAGPGFMHGVKSLAFFITPLLLCEFLEDKKIDRSKAISFSPLIKAALYNVYFYFFIYFGDFGANEFIYFKF